MDSRKDKVVIFYPHVGEYGGIERNIIGLAEGIVKQRLQPVLLCFYDRVGMGKYIQQLEVIQLEDHWNPFVKAGRLKKWISDHKLSIKGLPFFFGGKAGFYGAITDVEPYALHYTDPPSLLSLAKKEPTLKSLVWIPRRFFSNLITKTGVKNADVRLTMTRWNAEELLATYGFPFDVVYQGGVPPAGNINLNARCQGDTLTMFSICRLAHSKNLNWILEAVKQISDDHSLNHIFKEIKIVIGGKGPEEDNLKALTDTLGLNDMVQFAGFLSDEQVEDTYQKSDLFLVPGRQGYGLPILESLYRHVPVVLNKESRISEMLADNAWASISENSVESFKNSIVNHVIRLRSAYPGPDQLANLPTEQDWAFNIGKHCLWW